MPREVRRTQRCRSMIEGVGNLGPMFFENGLVESEDCNKRYEPSSGHRRTHTLIRVGNTRSRSYL